MRGDDNEEGTEVVINFSNMMILMRMMRKMTMLEGTKLCLRFSNDDDNDEKDGSEKPGCATT